MATVDQTSIRNRLLAALSAEDFASLRPNLEPLALPVRYSLNEPNQPTAFVHFLDEGIGSIVGGPERSTGIEIGVVGWEGFVGTSVVLGAMQSPHACFMQLAGHGWRIPADALTFAMDRSAELRSLLLRYVHVFMVQISSTAYANADFTVEERLARWILMCHDRVEGNHIAMTHELVALMLGVRRPGVTVATHVLEGEHMIKARRGLITVLDREKLKKTADGSYGFAEAEYDRVLGHIAVKPSNLVLLPPVATV